MPVPLKFPQPARAFYESTSRLRKGRVTASTKKSVQGTPSDIDGESESLIREKNP
jgi:hypothetical protein